jgi:hypothetical protein
MKIGSMNIPHPLDGVLKNYEKYGHKNVNYKKFDFGGWIAYPPEPGLNYIYGNEMKVLAYFDVIPEGWESQLETKEFYDWVIEQHLKRMGK